MSPAEILGCKSLREKSCAFLRATRQFKDYSLPFHLLSMKPPFPKNSQTSAIQLSHVFGTIAAWKMCVVNDLKHDRQ